MATFALGPTHPRAPEMDVQPGVPQGIITNFTMKSEDKQDLSRNRA